MIEPETFLTCISNREIAEKVNTNSCQCGLNHEL